MTHPDRDMILAEFPDFDWIDGLPDTQAAGLNCCAWHNDTCPRFETTALTHDGANGWQVFIDFRDPARREIDTGGVYVVGWVDERGCYDRDAYTGDDWSEVLRVLAGPTS